MEMIELCDATFTKEILDGTVFFQYAEGGAMGEPGGIVIVTEEGKAYHANYCFGDLQFDTMERAFPVLKECEFGLFGIDSKVPSGWVYVNLGAGNHLIVREDYYEKFSPHVSGYTQLSDMYANWLKVAESIV